MNKKNGLKNYVMAVILVIVAVLIDQYTKYLAVTPSEGRSCLCPD